jgi:hypothetical protein
MVFALPLRQFYHDGTNPASLSGLSHLDNFIMTQKSYPLTGTVQKLMPTPTQTATKLYHRAVRVHCLPEYLIISVADAIQDFTGLTKKKKRVPAALAPGTCR